MRSIPLWFALVILITLVPATQAQPPALSGDFAGTLGPLHLKLHLKSGESGAITGTLDSLEQQAIGLPCANFSRSAQKLEFEVPSVGGRWSGTVSADGNTLTGTWTQSGEAPLVFRREEKRSAVDGFWLGSLNAGGTVLRVQISVSSDAAGAEHCLLDSLDQGSMGLECTDVRLAESAFSFSLPVVGGSFRGTLSKDGNEIEGTWTQGGASLPLKLARQAAPVEGKKVEPPQHDAALPPVPLDKLKEVLDQDLRKALEKGALAPATGNGVVIGVTQHGQRRIFTYGAVKEDSLFEIGSITKTFTGLLLAQMVEQGKVKIDEPVRLLLPAGVVAKPDGPEITLVDLSSQHSGLPRMPDNFKPNDPQNPYADYTPKLLYEEIKKLGVSKAAKPAYGYSNLGVGLLGQALAERAGMTYASLLRTEIVVPLSLHDTVIALSPEQTQRFAAGHNPQHRTVHAWDLDGLAGAGAIRSTASDMLTYLDAQLHPEKLAKANAGPLSTLPAAIELSHQLRADALPGMKIALGWHYIEESGSYWHNGGTGGFNTYALFNPREDYTAVVLFNQSSGFADQVAQHVEARLRGKPAISLGE